MSMRLCYVNHVDTAVVTASNQNASFPVSNLLSPRRNRVWRSSTSGSVSFYMHWNGDTRTPGFLGGFRHNAYDGAKWQLVLYSDTAGTASVLDVMSGAVVAVPSIQVGTHTWNGYSGTRNVDLGYFRAPAFKWFTPTACKSARLTFTVGPNTAAGAAAYWEFSRLCLGSFYEFERTPDFGMQSATEDNDLSATTIGMSSLRDAGARRKIITLDRGSMGLNERAIVQDLIDEYGRWGDFVLGIHVGQGGRIERDHLVNGSFTNADPIAHVNVRRFSRRMIFREN